MPPPLLWSLSQTFIPDTWPDGDLARVRIRDLCDRVSPSGIFDGIKAVFSGDALNEIKEIADDVKEVLRTFAADA